MKALKITFRFASPLLFDSDRPIHLDALVASAVMREHEEFGTENPWRASDDLSSIFESTERSLEFGWVWKASMLKFRASAPRQWVNQTRRSDPIQTYEDLGKFWVGGGKKTPEGVGDKFTISTSSGQQRGYQWLNSTQFMESAEAWAVAEPDALHHYLSKISQIGKKGANGYGLISGFTVNPSGPDESDNWMVRTMPQGMPGKSQVQYERVSACLRAPYWKKINRVIAMDPVI